MRLYEIIGGYWTGLAADVGARDAVAPGWHNAPEPPALAEGQYAVLSGSVWAVTTTPPPAAVAPVPASVTRFQARAALHLAGHLSAVEAAMADPGMDPLARLAWQDALEFVRASPTVAGLAGALGLTDAQIDDLFRLAATITA